MVNSMEVLGRNTLCLLNLQMVNLLLHQNRFIRLLTLPEVILIVPWRLRLIFGCGPPTLIGMVTSMVLHIG